MKIFVPTVIMFWLIISVCCTLGSIIDKCKLRIIVLSIFSLVISVFTFITYGN